MSRTKRIYNFPNKTFHVWTHNTGWVPYWHPYKELCVGHCSFCREDRVSKWRRAQWKQDLNRELRNLCPHYSVINKNECFCCQMRWHGDDCDYVMEC